MTRVYGNFTHRRLPWVAVALVLGCGEGGHATAPTTPAADSPAPVGAIVAVSPAQLRDTVAHTVPVVVRVVSATGAGLPNYVVHFTTAGTGGTVSPTTVVSDAAGSAAAAWTLGQAAGGDTLIASVGPRTTQVVVATAVAAAPARFALVSGDAQSDTVGAPLPTPIAVRVTDAFGNAAPGASVQFAVASGHGALSAAVSLTDSTGVASTRWTLGADAGAQAMTAAVANIATPVTVHAWASLPVLQATAISTGANDFACAVSAGQVFCWGANDSGQLGDGTQQPRGVARAVHADVQFTDVSVGFAHACALSTTGDAYCWGWNAWGQVGDGTTTDRWTPTRVNAPMPFVQVTTGAGYSCGRTQVGYVYCWGIGSDARTITSPLLVTTSVQFQSIQAGGFNPCGVANVNTLYCVVDMQVYGPGPTMVVWQPAAMGAVPVTASASSVNQVCGLTTSGVANCWMMSQQRMALWSIGQAATVQVSGAERFVSIRSGFSSVCALSASGVPYCWNAGTAGVPSVPSQRVAALAMPQGMRFTTLQASLDFSCGIATTGVAYCWGQGDNGQLGDGDAGTPHARMTPGAVLRGK